MWHYNGQAISSLWCHSSFKQTGVISDDDNEEGYNIKNTTACDITLFSKWYIMHFNIIFYCGTHHLDFGYTWGFLCEEICLLFIIHTFPSTFTVKIQLYGVYALSHPKMDVWVCAYVCVLMCVCVCVCVCVCACMCVLILLCLGTE